MPPGPVSACPLAPARGYSPVPGRAVGRTTVERGLEAPPGRAPSLTGHHGTGAAAGPAEIPEAESERLRAASGRRAEAREWLKSDALWVGLAAGGGVLLDLVFRRAGRGPGRRSPLNPGPPGPPARPAGKQK
jgi:hypothetical protein